MNTTFVKVIARLTTRMKLSELKAVCVKAIEEGEARERKMGKDKLAELPYRQTPLGELEALFSELSELTSDAQLWDLEDDQGLEE